MNELNDELWTTIYGTHSWPFFEDSDNNGVYGRGWVDQTQFANLVNDYDHYTSGYDPDGYYSGEDVFQGYGVKHQMPGDDDWVLILDGITETTPGAFKVTWVSR